MINKINLSYEIKNIYIKIYEKGEDNQGNLEEYNLFFNIDGFYICNIKLKKVENNNKILIYFFNHYDFESGNENPLVKLIIIIDNKGKLKKELVFGNYKNELQYAIQIGDFNRLVNNVYLILNIINKKILKGFYGIKNYKKYKYIGRKKNIKSFKIYSSDIREDYLINVIKSFEQKGKKIKQIGIS